MAETLKINYCRLDEIQHLPGNPKAHELDSIIQSIQEFGFIDPIGLTEQGQIDYDGNGRLDALLAMLQQGLAAPKGVRVDADGMWAVPVIGGIDWLEGDKLMAAGIALNRTNEKGGWTINLLADALTSLAKSGALAGTGYSSNDLDIILKKVRQEQGEAQADGEDTAPDLDLAEQLREKWGTELDQVWQLGDHRMICGDSTDAGTVSRMMGQDLAALCFTSPPYAQQREYRDDATSSVQDWDALMAGVFSNIHGAEDIQILVNLGLVHRENEWIPYWENWISWMRAAGWRRFAWYVWDQGSGMLGDWNGRLGPSFEFVFHFNQQARHPNKIIPKDENSIKVKFGKGLRNKDGSIKKVTSPDAGLQPNKIPDSVIRIFRSSEPIRSYHPAVFSLEFALFNVAVWTAENEIVYEPFSGSGTTLIACEQLRRRCRAVEISPAYAAVALERWSTMTGKKPVLQEG